MSEIKILQQLWQQYTNDNPHVVEIHELFLKKNTQIINDHIALRTINDSRIDIEVLAKPFIKEGYFENGEYKFKAKKLFAKHYQHKDPTKPKFLLASYYYRSLLHLRKASLRKSLTKFRPAY